MAYTYILECANGEYYVGSTEDIVQRLQEHQTRTGGRFTKLHQPVKLVYKDVEPWTVVGGNPAKVIKKRVMRVKENRLLTQ